MHTIARFASTFLVLSTCLSTGISAQVTVDNPPGTFASLGVAIASASPGATITIDDTVPITFNESNLVILGSQEPLTIVPLNNIYPPNVTVDGTGLSGSIFVFQAGITNATLLHGLNIVNGTGTLVGGRLVGGGIACIDGASPLIRNCVIRDNTADDGGGVYIGLIDDVQGPRLMRNVIRLNAATNNGGGVYLELNGEFAFAPQFSRSRINENTAGWAGGGFYAGSGTTPQLTQCWVMGNQAVNFGGGVCFEFTKDAGIASTMVENNSTGSNGSGGGLAVLDAARTKVENSTFSGNWSVTGGGIHDAVIGDDSWASLYVNDLIVGNTSAGFGGGMAISYVDPSIEFCTIAYNSAGTGTGGGGIAHAGVTVDHAIVWGNTPNGLVAFGGGVAAINHSDIQGGAFGTNISVDPQFTPGATTGPCANTTLDTYHLTQASNQCVDFGPLAVTAYPAVVGRSTDPDRLVPDTGLVDIGFHYPGQGCL